MSVEPLKMRNLGPKSSAWLRQVGLKTPEALAEVGPLEAFMRVKRAGFKPSLNLLYALEGALLDCHWQEVPTARREELVAAAEAAIAQLPAPRNKPAAAPVTTTVMPVDPDRPAFRDPHAADQASFRDPPSFRDPAEPDRPSFRDAPDPD